MDNDNYVYIITALLPLAATMLILQTNPYHALVIRGVLGAVAALVYAVLGAADVALTEALVGTLLAITLYAVAVRSSLVLRLGVLKNDLITAETEQTKHFQQCLDDLRTLFNQYHLRVELVPYSNQIALQEGLMKKEIHATCARPPAEAEDRTDDRPSLSYHLATRLRRIHEILQAGRESSAISMATNISDYSEVRS